MAELNNDQYIEALTKMKNSPGDRVGILGQLGTTAIGAGLGVATAGSIASIAGASTLLGSSTLGSVLGGVFITATPVGWVIGSAIGLGALGFAVAKMVKSGGESDAIKEMNMTELRQRIADNERVSKSSNVDDEKYQRFVVSIQLLIKNGRITQQKSTQLLENIQKGRISIDSAFNMIRPMLA